MALNEPKKGSVIREILVTPVFKEILRGHLRGIDTRKAPEMIKTIMWQDVEVFLGILGALPPVINKLAGNIGEAGKQIGEKFTPQLLKEFVNSLLKDTDLNALKECGTTYKDLARRFLEYSPEITSGIADGLARAIAKGINSFSYMVNSKAQQDPEFLDRFMTEIGKYIDKEALRDASLRLTDAVLDHRPHIAPLAGKIILERVKKRLKGKR